MYTNALYTYILYIYYTGDTIDTASNWRLRKKQKVSQQAQLLHELEFSTTTDNSANRMGVTSTGVITYEGLLIQQQACQTRLSEIEKELNLTQSPTIQHEYNVLEPSRTSTGEGVDDVINRLIATNTNQTATYKRDILVREQHVLVEKAAMIARLMKVAAPALTGLRSGGGGGGGQVTNTTTTKTSLVDKVGTDSTSSDSAPLPALTAPMDSTTTAATTATTEAANVSGVSHSIHTVASAPPVNIVRKGKPVPAPPSTRGHLSAMSVSAILQAHKTTAPVDNNDDNMSTSDTSTSIEVKEKDRPRQDSNRGPSLASDTSHTHTGTHTDTSLTTKVKGPMPPTSSEYKKGQNYDQLEGGDYVWVPPTGQTGSGRTSLNDKLGY